MSTTTSASLTSPGSYHYCTYLGAEIPDEFLSDCAALFSNNYGIWGEKAPTISRYTKTGICVKMSIAKLQAQCVSNPEHTVLVTCVRNEEIVGHAFATIWNYDGGVVGWITQLVVDICLHKRYIATVLLQTLKDHVLFQNVTTVGLVSSYPAACHALTKYAYKFSFKFLSGHG